MDPFSYSSSSSSPPSSSPSHHHHHHQHHHHQRTLTFIPPPPPGTDNSGNASVGSWLGTRFDPDGEHLNSGSTEEEPEEPGMPVSGGTYSSVAEIQKEHMFDKVVTPSDVGKLNRLVIPKQHAEKYFPLDSSANDKGLLLNFEDRNGKPWRFRYSYWNSSQSYVMTKGWSRFVKEKKLDAGDIVSFQRGVGEAGKDRLFIDWRRRPEHRHPSSVLAHGSVHWGSSGPPPHPFLLRHVRENPQNGYFGGSGFNYGYGNVVNVSPCSGGSLYYLSRWSMAQTLPPQVGGGGNYGGNSGGPEPSIPVVFDSVPVVQGKAAGKRLRLFGVNLDCPNPESSDPHPISHAIAIGSQPHPPPPPPPPQSHHQLQLASASSSPSPSQNPHLQLRLYNGIPLMSKGEASSSSSMSLDLDI